LEHKSTDNVRLEEDCWHSGHSSEEGKLEVMQALGETFIHSGLKQEKHAFTCLQSSKRCALVPRKNVSQNPKPCLARVPCSGQGKDTADWETVADAFFFFGAALAPESWGSGCEVTRPEGQTALPESEG
jgi:hypothetical protein